MGVARVASAAAFAAPGWCAPIALVAVPVGGGGCRSCYHSPSARLASSMASFSDAASGRDCLARQLPGSFPRPRRASPPWRPPRAARGWSASAFPSGPSTSPSSSSVPPSASVAGDLPTVWPPAIVLVIGGPGSGKGTLSAALATRAGAVHLSAGELLRAEAARPTAAGAAIDALLRRGDIVPSEVTVRLLHEAMCRAAGGGGRGGGGADASEHADSAVHGDDAAWRSARFVIDGFPRNGSNREAWTAAGGRPAAVLELVVPPAVLRSRLLSRGEGRADDTASVVERRLAVAAAEGGSVASWYEAEGLLTRLDGGQRVEEVLDAALAALEGVCGWSGAGSSE
ncbi:hypothetical protein MMPV_008189 [Pyropia vietnamensis]